MLRQIIKIDENKCIGCSLCVQACMEGAIEMIDGKAKLVREDFCDGLGNCLPNCPVDAISFEEREAPAYDGQAALQAKKEDKKVTQAQASESACPGSASLRLNSKPNLSKVSKDQGDLPKFTACPGSMSMALKTNREEPEDMEKLAFQDQPYYQLKPKSQLGQWPCQIKLVPARAPFFDGAKLLVAADCTAFAYGNFHQEFMRGKITLIGCPKLDEGDYSQKLTDIISNNNIKEVTIIRMEVPCCSGLQRAVETALQASGKFMPWQVITVSRDGRILD